MAVHRGASKERRWSDLPGDLLSAIYLRSASAYDRARFSAVCSPWRAVAAWHPRLPALPLLLSSTGDGKHDREARAYTPEDGRALSVPLPLFPWGNQLVGSHDGGWIATVSGSGELLVVNLFSAVQATPLITDQIFIRKIVFSKDPSSGDCLLVAMTSRCTVAVRRVGCPDSGWTTRWCDPDCYGDLVDIAFCNGELYGVTSDGLIVFDIGMSKEGAIWIFRVDVAISSLYTVEVPSAVKYIFELHGKPAIAVEAWPEYHHKKGHFFRVFELAHAGNDTATSHRYTWAEVTSLGDHALFLGPVRCKAVQVSTACRRGGVKGNHIYYSKQHSYLHNNMECLPRLDIGSCTVHCCESQGVHHLERIVSRGYHGANGCNSCVWLWPPDF